ncbi:hypothetical protein CY658_31715 [Variovorax sp. RO1]|nr:hypothetical protein CY658_31715 [Variovorax sp. RO1]
MHLYLVLALFGTAAQASMPVSQDDGWTARAVAPVATAPVVAAVMGLATMPVAMDAVPCALCYSAPAPSLHTFGGECRGHEAAAWPVRVAPVPDGEYFDAGGRHVRLPVRILYCRWLD